jgi:signal transduction histidine kinase
LLQGHGTLFGSYEKNEIDSYTRDIQVATKQMMEIVNDLLSISRLESRALVVKADVLNVGAILNDLVVSLTPKIKLKRLKISMHIAKDARAFSTDRSLFTIIVQNLISNAVKYAYEGGVVSVSVTKEDAHEVVIVSDVGPGIPREEQKKIFDKFFRASNVVHQEHEGTGLGLYITRAMVEELHGTISFVSEEGHGTTFVVRLPPGGGERMSH